jgi:hypothetical protein
MRHQEVPPTWCISGHRWSTRGSDLAISATGGGARLGDIGLDLSDQVSDYRSCAGRGRVWRQQGSGERVIRQVVSNAPGLTGSPIDEA